MEIKETNNYCKSLTESEYIMLSEAGQKAFWLRNLYDELGFPQIGLTVIKNDNEGSVILSLNSMHGQNTLRYATTGSETWSMTKFLMYGVAETQSRQLIY